MKLHTKFGCTFLDSFPHALNLLYHQLRFAVGTLVSWRLPLWSGKQWVGSNVHYGACTIDWY
jgi:hypothetical protein